MRDVRVGIFPTAGAGLGEVADRRAALARAAEEGMDHVAVGDHVSFFVGAGSDGLINATAVLSMQTELPVYSASTCCRCAIRSRSLDSSPASPSSRTRGRRMDECLQILRGLAEGEPVTFEGEFFSLEDALIVPAPSPPIPLIVGGRSEAALVRAGRLGDGWLGVWVSPQRFAAAWRRSMRWRSRRAGNPRSSRTR